MPGEHGQVLTDRTTVGPMAERAAVLGSPIAHSLSPALHTAGYRALGLDDWDYTRADVAEHELVEFVAGAGPGVARPVADAAAQGGRLRGGDHRVRRGPRHGVDQHPAPAPRRRVGRRQHRRRRSARGAGGGRRRARRAAGRRGVGGHRPVGRRGVRRPRRHAGRLHGARRGPRRHAASRPRRPGSSSRAATSATGPAASTSSSRPCPGTAPRPRPPSRRAAVRSSTSSTARPARFTELAPERGYAVAPGVAMLLHQAAEQFRMMTGHPAPLEAMRAGRRSGAPVTLAPAVAAPWWLVAVVTVAGAGVGWLLARELGTGGYRLDDETEPAAARTGRPPGRRGPGAVGRPGLAPRRPVTGCGTARIPAARVGRGGAVLDRPRHPPAARGADAAGHPRAARAADGGLRDDRGLGSVAARRDLWRRRAGSCMRCSPLSSRAGWAWATQRLGGLVALPLGYLGWGRRRSSGSSRHTSSRVSSRWWAWPPDG